MLDSVLRSLFGEKVVVSLARFLTQHTGAGPATTEFAFEATVGRLLHGPMPDFMLAALADRTFVFYTSTPVFQMGSEGPITTFLEAEARLAEDQPHRGVLALRTTIQGEQMKAWRRVGEVLMVSTEDPVTYAEAPSSGDGAIAEFLGIPKAKGTGTRCIYISVAEIAAILQGSVISSPRNIRPAGRLRSV